MTNNEKVQRIFESVESLVRNAGVYAGQENMCSAEWIYAQARYRTLTEVLGRIERIAYEKEK